MSPPGEEVALLWREAYYPAWHAYLRSDDLVEREIPILVAGPGFMLIPIDNIRGPSVVELVWETPLIERLAAGISILALVTLGIFIIDGVVAGGRLFDWIGLRFKPRKKKELPRGSIAWLPDLVDEESESGL